MNRIKVLLMGAAGREFHNFNVLFKDNYKYEVVGFTAAQIPDITGRKYPKELSGKLYPRGIPIYGEEKLPELIRKLGVETVVLAYSDLPYFHVMHKASLVLANGANFSFLGPDSTMLLSKKKVIAVTAVRTGCGKSQTTRRIVDILRNKGRKVVVVRHPMPYGDLRKQVCQRFASYKDLDKHECTIEEREEYEPLIDRGVVVYSGVDYEKILREAEKDANIIIWDGGNNDFPFFKPNLHICLTDPHRAGHEITYYPGETNFRMANVIIINKEKTALKKNIKLIKKNIKKYNPSANVIDAYSIVSVNKPDLIKNKKVVVVEDGPTLTHGGMSFGAGIIAARECGSVVINPRKYAFGSLKEIYKKYPRLGSVIPAMGYSKKQIKELEKTLNKAKCDAIISATPIDLRRIIKINKPIVRIKYELVEIGKPTLKTVLKKF